MNSAEFITALSQKLQLSKSEVTKRVEDVASIITTELLKDNSVSLGSFGTFNVKKRQERISVNPSSGKKMLLPPKLVVKFKVSSSLKDKLKGIKL